MKFTLSWLKRHLDTNASLDEICKTLTDIGLELEDLDNPAEKFAAFKVAYVEKAEQHPNADRLKVLHVKHADGETDLVCGAPNARAGMKGIFAPEGSYIPGSDMVLKKANIRGVDSVGMMVSEREMGLSDEHEGIIEVDDSYEIGTPMADVFGLDDPVIEINLTPNRADCAGVRGIARDLAAAGLGTLIGQEEGAVAPAEADDNAPRGALVTIDNEEDCPLFLGRMIRGIKNGQSPQWMQTYLKAIGLRPISALVDITNFMTHDQCRPLHVYDAAKLQGDIRVGNAEGGEELEALDDKTYKLNAGDVTINDDRGVIGLGGIVGGVSTGCDEGTVDVFLESAYFRPMRIARSGRDLGVESDARYRFERGVDPEFTYTGLEMATRLILEICGGEAGAVVQAGAVPDWKRVIEYDHSYVEQFMGFDVPATEQQAILEALGFAIDGTHITPPSWRGDVEGKADIVEEVARITGYDKIPAVSVQAEGLSVQGAETATGARIRKSRTALASRGMSECVTWSFMKKDRAALFGSNDNEGLALTNPISSELDQMRPSILPNLIEAAANNADRGYGDVALCEVGPVFRSSKTDGQDMVAAGIRAGSYNPRHWAPEENNRAVDVYDVKADALAALEACGVVTGGLQITTDAPDYYHPGRSGVLRQGKNVLAIFGEIHPLVKEELDIKQAVCGFEVYLENIPEARKKGTAKKLLKLEPLQPVQRDFAFIVDENVKAEDIAKSAAAADKKLISDAVVFDVYAGKGIEEGKKSIALNVTIQPKDKTLTEEDFEALSESIIANVNKKTGGVLRG